MMHTSFRGPVGLAAVGAMLVALLVPVTLLQPGTAHALTEDYGSIAYSPSKQVVAAGLGFTQAGAKNAALYQCVANGGAADCWALDWFYDAVGAFAVASNGAYGSGQGWADNAANATAGADTAATQICQQYGGTDCKVTFHASTSYVSDSGTGGAYPQPTLPGTLIPVSAGTTVPAGKYEAAGGADFDTATCFATLAAIGIATYLTDGTIELSVPAATEIGNTIVENCGGFVLSSLVGD